MGSSFASSGTGSVHLYNCGGSAMLRKTKSLSDLSARLALPIKGQTTTDAVVPQQQRIKLNVSQVILDNMDQDSASPSYEQCKLRSLLPNCAIPIHHSQQQQQQLLPHSAAASNQQSMDDEGSQIGGCGGGGARHLQKSADDNNTSTTTTSNNNPSDPNSAGGAAANDRQPSFNLVKLFIKQKSSTDTCMDVSSGCWPSADSSSQSLLEQQQQQTINANIHNRNYFKRRIDGSASNLARHDEENDVDSLDPLLNNKAVNAAAANPDQNRNNHEQHNVLENNNNLINNLINNNHLSQDNTTTTTTASSEEQTNITQIYNNIRNNNNAHTPKNSNLRRLHMETVTRSMQTSIPKLITSATQYATTKAAVAVATGRGAPVHNRSTTAATLNQRVKIVPASFLRQLHKNERRGDGGMAPVYVIYPNYTLPNLDFLSKHEVILSPIDYKETFMGVNGVKRRERAKGAISKIGGGAAGTAAAVVEEEIAKGTARLSLTSNRPKSFNDILSGGGKKAKFDYKNIYDWKSLIILLPMEYSR